MSWGREDIDVAGEGVDSQEVVVRGVDDMAPGLLLRCTAADRS